MNYPRFLFVVAFLAGCCIANPQDRAALTPAPCTAVQTQNWQFIEKELGGAVGFDPSASAVGSYPAGKFGFEGIYLFPRNWIPASETKEIMCGKLQRFDWFSGVGDEQDWNLRIIPASPSFQGVFSDVAQYASKVDDIWSCNPNSATDQSRHACTGVNVNPPANPVANWKQHNCLEAEVTPNKDFYENPWFKKNEGCSTKIDQSICVYGPLVTESVHGNRPEIHPLEVLWWKNPDREQWTFLHIADASNRFNASDDFADVPRPQPPEWTPWSGLPRIAMLELAFSVPSQNAAGGQPLSYSIFQEFGTAVKPIENPSGSKVHLLNYGGVDIVSVTEQQGASNSYNVQFVDVCTAPDHTVQGLIRLRSEIGTSRQGEETDAAGHQVLHIVQGWKTEDPTPLSQAQPPSEMSFIVPSSLHFESVGNKRVLKGTLVGADPEAVRQRARRELKDTGDLFSVRHSFSKNDLESLQNLEPANVSPNVNLNGDGQVSVANQQVPIPNIGLVSRVGTGRFSYHREPLNLHLLSSVIGAKKTTEVALPTIRVDEFSITALPQFVTKRNGAFFFEEENELTETLNEALFLSQGTVQRVFGTTKPDVQPKWSFQAFDCGNQPDMNCSNAKEIRPLFVPPPLGVRDHVYIVSDPTADNEARVRVFFPNRDDQHPKEGHLYKVVGTAKTTDRYADGGTTDMVVEFYNVALEMPDTSPATVSKALDSIASLAGVDAAVLRPQPLDSHIISPAVQVSSWRKAELIRLYVVHSGRQGFLDPGALRTLISAARALAKPN